MKKLSLLLIAFSFLVLSCAKTNDKPDNAVLFENFEGKEYIGWTGTPMTLNGNTALSLKPIDNKYFGVGAEYKPDGGVLEFDGNPVLQFKCFGGSSSLYVSFYNESQEDNFHYTWRGLTPHSWNQVEIPFSWFRDNEYKGKTLKKGDRITKLNFFAGKTSQKPLMFIDDITLGFTKNSVEEPQLPSTFSESFESKPSHWIGKRISNLPGNREGWALKAIPVENKYFGMKASYEPSKPFYRIDTDLFKKPILTFSYYMSQKTLFYVSLFNPRKDDNYHFQVRKPVIGKWTTVSSNLLTLNDNSNRGVLVAKGDHFTNLRFFVGKPGTDIDVLIDDVKIESKVIEREDGFDMTKRSFAPYVHINRNVIQHMRTIYSDKNTPKSIMTLGDSISESQAFVAMLRLTRDGMLLGQGYTYVDKALCARKSQLSGWGTKTVDNALTQAHPEAVTILFGTNDVNTYGKPGIYLANMEYIIDACLKNGSIPILLTIPPTTRKPLERVEKFNYQLHKLAEEKVIPLIDIYRLFRDQPNWQALLADGIHPNYFENDSKVSGYSLMNDIIFETYKFLEMEITKREEMAPSWFIDSFDYSLPDMAQIIFKFNFDSTKQGWTGKHVPSPDKPDSNKCVKLLKKRELETRIGNTFRVSPTTYIAVSCYAVDCQRMRVQLHNRTQNDNFWAAQERIPQRQWITLYFDLNRDFQDNENRDKEIQFHDLFDAIQIYAGIISDESALYIDDVVVFNATPKSFTHTLQTEFKDLKKQFADLLFDATPNDPLVQTLSNLQSEIKSALTKMPAENVAALKDTVDRFKDLIHALTLKNKMNKEFPDLSSTFSVGYASPMRRISPHHHALPFIGTVTNKIELFSAQHESEHFQLYLMPFTPPTRTVSLSFSDLKHEAENDSITAQNISWFIEDYITTKRSWPVPCYILGTKPDPLIPGTPFDLTEPTMLWVSVYVPPGQKPGTYQGTLKIESDGDPVNITISVRVWNFELPRTGRLQTPTTFGLGLLKAFYGRHPTQVDRRRWYSFLLNHRIDPTSLYHFGLHPTADDIEFCDERGIRTFILGGHHYSNSIVDPDKIQRYYAILKEKGVLDKALIYIGDETGAKDTYKLQQKADWVHTNCPGLKTFAGINPRPELFGYIDVWDPSLAGMGYNDWDNELAVQRQAEGDRVMWYVAAGPSFPYPNVQMDNQLIESRIIFWMTWKYGLDGWEYYYINLWGDNMYGRGEKKWPDVPWDTYSFKSGNNYNGDGMLIYPGPNMIPYASIRLKNIYDGIEDYETLNLLSQYVDQAQSLEEKSDGLNDLIAQAEDILAVPADIVQDIAHFTRDADQLHTIRNKVGFLIEQLKARIAK